MSNSPSEIIEREIIQLKDAQNTMLRSGWGTESIDNTVVEKITYLSDQLKVKGYTAYPANKSEKYPCIIWNRGGIGDRGEIGRAHV